MMPFALIAVAALSAGLSASCIVQMCFSSRREIYGRRRLLDNAGCEGVLEAHRVALVSKGVVARLLSYAAWRSSRMGEGRSVPAAFQIGLAGIDESIVHAGLRGAINREGVAEARLHISLLAMGLGLVFGYLLSEIMALLLGVLGLCVGLASIPYSLRQEARARSALVERELSQMLEVLILGLQGGLSFDGALVLYQRYYHGLLSGMCSYAYDQYSHGLSTRGDALKAMASSVDSPLLSRAVESVIRSMRFGTSLSSTLSSLASESRSFRKTHLEERIAKAPVKMLVPVGTLILPAMLILILGPVVLDLIEGF